MGLAGTPATTAITASLPEAKQGVASAVNDLSREFGSALGIAVLGSLLTTTYRRSLAPTLPACPAPVAEGARASVAFGPPRPPAGSARPAGSWPRPPGRRTSTASRPPCSPAPPSLVAAAVFVFFRAPRAQELPVAEPEPALER